MIPPFTWVVGAFYFHDVPEIKLGVNQNPPPNVDAQVKTTKTGQAVFGHMTYDVNSSLEVELGMRYTKSDSKKEGETILFNLAPFPIVLDQAAQQKDDAFTSKVALNWTLNKEHFMYAFYAEGYKAGGVNSPGTPVFEPEKVTDYEVGLKSKWLNGQVKTQLNAYYMDYQDMQLGSYLIPDGNSAFGGGNGITNIGEATVKGLEAQLQLHVNNFRLDTGFSYTNSTLGETLYTNPALLPAAGNIPLGPDCASSASATCFDYSGATNNLAGVENAYSPKFTFTAGLEYSFELENSTAVVARVDYSYTDEQWTTIQQSPSDYLKARSLVNASLSYLTENWEVELFTTNLTNETYIAGFDGTGWFLGRPREVAIKASYLF